MTRSHDVWVGQLSVTRHPYILNKLREPRTLLQTHSQGTSIFQISPSEKKLTLFYHLRQRHHSTSNFGPERLSHGYCQYQHPWNDRGNSQRYYDQAVWQLGKMLHITHTHMHHEKIPGLNPTRRKYNPGVILRIINANKPVWRNT